MKDYWKVHRNTTFMLIGLALIPLLYGGLYFAVLDLPGSLRLPGWLVGRQVKFASYIDVNGDWEVFPDYHGLPDGFFAPMHSFDQKYLRPTLWSGSNPNARGQELSFDWLLGQFSSPAQ